MIQKELENGIVACGEYKFKKLYSEEEILESIQRIADEMNNVYVPILKQNPSEKIIFIGILKGAFMFTTDLMKRLKFPVFVDFLKVVSYKGTESKELTIQTKIDEDLYKDAHLIVIDDICDSGKTLAKLVEKMKQFEAKTVRTAVLINRPDKKHHVNPDHFGLDCSDFIIGYGLDYNQMGRQYPCIYQKIDE